MDAVAVTVSAAARTGAARAVRRVATAERVASVTPARGEAAKAVAAIVVHSRTIGAAAESERDSNDRGVVEYNFACLQARSDRIPEALAVLEDTLVHGVHFDPSYAKSDEDLMV